MADISNGEFNTTAIEDKTSGNDLTVNSDGSIKSRLLDGSGSSVAKGQSTMAGSLPVVLASDQTTVPISTGLPTFLDKTFGFAIGINQPTAGSDNPLIYLRNPSGSGKIFYLGFRSYGIAVANVLGTVRLYRNPTVSANGTSQTVVQFGTATTVTLVTTVPTVTSFGTLINSEVSGQNTSSLQTNYDYKVAILAGESLLITGDPGSNNRQAEISIRWIEI